MGVPRVYLSAHLCQISIVMSMNMCNCAVRAAAAGGVHLNYWWEMLRDFMIHVRDNGGPDTKGKSSNVDNSQLCVLRVVETLTDRLAARTSLGPRCCSRGSRGSKLWLLAAADGERGL